MDITESPFRKNPVVMKNIFYQRRKGLCSLVSGDNTLAEGFAPFFSIKYAFRVKIFMVNVAFMGGRGGGCSSELRRTSGCERSEQTDFD